jgi:hypothetical protein
MRAVFRGLFQPGPPNRGLEHSLNPVNYSFERLHFSFEICAFLLYSKNDANLEKVPTNSTFLSLIRRFLRMRVSTSGFSTGALRTNGLQLVPHVCSKTNFSRSKMNSDKERAQADCYPGQREHFKSA